MQNKTPDRFYIRKSNRKDYGSLLERGSPFEGKDNKHVFMMAMLTGFRDGSKLKLDKKFGFFRTEYLTPGELSIIKAIAIAETEDLDVLLDKKKVYSIAEEYAAGGIKLLKDRVSSGGYGSYIKKLEESLVDAFKKIEKTIK